MTTNTDLQSQTVTNFPDGSFTPVPDLLPFSLGAPPPPHVPLRKDEIVSGLREIFGKYGIRMRPDESQIILAAVYKLEMQP